MFDNEKLKEMIGDAITKKVTEETWDGVTIEELKEAAYGAVQAFLVRGMLAEVRKREGGEHET